MYGMIKNFQIWPVPVGSVISKVARKEIIFLRLFILTTDTTGMSINKMAE